MPFISHQQIATNCEPLPVPELCVATADFAFELDQSDDVRVDHVNRKRTSNLALRHGTRQLVKNPAFEQSELTTNTAATAFDTQCS